MTFNGGVCSSVCFSEAQIDIFLYYSTSARFILQTHCITDQHPGSVIHSFLFQVIVGLCLSSFYTQDTPSKYHLNVYLVFLQGDLLTLMFPYRLN